MKILSFMLSKGGSTKTSVSVSVAQQLALNNKKVLFIDADPQGNSTSWLVKSMEHEFSDCLVGETPLPVSECITHTDNPNLDILGTFGIKGKLKEYRESAKPNSKPFLFRSLLEPLSDTYDYCIFDTSPSNSPLERNVILASDEIIPTLLFNQFSIDGLEIFLNSFNEVKQDWGSNCKAQINSIVISGRDSRISFQNESMASIEALTEAFNVFLINTDQAFNRAQKAQIPVQSEKDVKKDTLETLQSIVNHIIGA